MAVESESGPFPVAMTSSMAGDLALGNRLELNWHSGAMIRMSRERGVDSPANGFIDTAPKPGVAGGDP